MHFTSRPFDSCGLPFQRHLSEQKKGQKPEGKDEGEPKRLVNGAIGFHPSRQGEGQGSDPYHAQTCGTGLVVEVAVALGCAAARAFAASLLELRSSAGADGPTPLSHEVEGFQGVRLA